MFSTGTPVEGAVNYTNANAVCGETVTGDNPTRTANRQNLALPIIQACAQPMGAKWISAVTNWLCFLIDGAGLDFQAGSACQDPMLLLNAVQALIADAATTTCLKHAADYPDNSDEVCAATPAYVWAAIQANLGGGGSTLGLTDQPHYSSYSDYSHVAFTDYNLTATSPGYVLQAILSQPVANTTSRGIARKATLSEITASATIGSEPAFLPPEALAGLSPLAQWHAFLHLDEVPNIGDILNFQWTWGTSYPGSTHPWIGQVITITTASAFGSSIADWGSQCTISVAGGGGAGVFQLNPNKAVQLGQQWLITGVWTLTGTGLSFNKYFGSAVRIA